MTKTEQQALAALAVLGVAAAYFLLRRNGDGEAPGVPYAPIMGTGGRLTPTTPETPTGEPAPPEPTVLEQAATVVGNFPNFLTGDDAETGAATGPIPFPDKDKPRSPSEWRALLRPMFRRLETTYAMPTGFLEAVADRESRFRQDIIEGTTLGGSGEEGIMQLMPQWHLSNFRERLDPNISVPYAANYLAKNFVRFGTWEEALAAYNWGPTKLAANGLQAAPAETKEYIVWVKQRNYVAGFV